jgi:tetratricopeptide (TPR) repeat protein
MVTKRKYRWILSAALVVAVFGLGGCAKKVNEFVKFRELMDEDREAQALTHYSYAQYLAQSGSAEPAIAELRLALKYDPASVHVREALAFLLYQQDKNDEAMAVVEEALKLDPRRARLYHLRGLILMEEQKYEEAEAALVEAAALDPDNPEYVIGLAESRLRQHKEEDALQVLDRFVQRHPEDLDSHYYIAVILQGMGRTEEAAAIYRRILEAAPGYYPALRNLFMNYFDGKNWERAAATGEELLALYPEDTESRLNLARAQAMAGKDDAALETLEQGKKLGETNPGIWTQEGFLYLQNDEPKKAREQFEGALAIDPANKEAGFGLGLAALDLNDYPEARERMEAVTEDSPLYLEAQKRLAFIALRQNDSARGLAIATRLYQQRPQDPEVVAVYAAVAREAGEYQLAETALKKALETFAGEEDLWYELGLVYFFEGRQDESLATMESILVANPKSARALNFIGYSWAEQGIKLDQAEAKIRRALELEPDAGYIMDSLGWVYYQRGDYRTALKWLTDAAENTGPDPEILEHLGDCFRALGKKDKARESYRQALDAGPTPRIRPRIENKLKELK